MHLPALWSAFRDSVVRMTIQKTKTSFIITGLALGLLPAGTSAQTPGSLLRPQIWLRADRGTVTGLNWQDYSGFGHNATTVQGQAPLVNGWLNFNPALRFDGINDRMNISFPVDSLVELTIMAVYQTTDSIETSVWSAENTSSRNMGLTTRTAAGPDSALDAIGRNEKFAVLSTVMQYWDRNLTPTQNVLLALGKGRTGGQAGNLKGILTEVLVFDRRLDGLTRIQYESYLAIKYGISLPDGNYVSQERILWNADRNRDHHYRIAGLGRNQTFDLDQKQSRSASDADSLFIISAGRLAATNAANSAFINEGDFWIWGDNNKNLSFTRGYEGLNQIQRKWLMQVTGNTATAHKTNLSLNLKKLPRNPHGYWLLVDRSGTSDFSADRLTYILPDSISRDSMAFYSVKWDADASGLDAFSFASAQPLFITMALDSPSCDVPTEGDAAFRAVGGRPPYAYELTNLGTHAVQRTVTMSKTGHMVYGNLPAGNYSLQLSDANGYTTTRNFDLVVPDALTVNLGPDQELLPGQEVLLDAGKDIAPGTEVRYQWQGSFGLSSGERSIRVKESGIYKVSVRTKQGCVFSDEVVIRVPGKHRFEVFPTLSYDGKFTVSISLLKQEHVQVHVYDINGKQVMQMSDQRTGSEFQFNGRLTAPGTYLVVLKTEKGTESRKLVVIP